MCKLFGWKKIRLSMAVFLVLTVSLLPVARAQNSSALATPCRNITQLQGADLNKAVSKALATEGTKDAKAFLLRQGFAPKFNNAVAITSENGLTVLLPLARGEDRAIISFGEAPDGKTGSAVGLASPKGDDVYVQTYEVQDGNINLVKDFTAEGMAQVFLTKSVFAIGDGEVQATADWCTILVTGLCGTGGGVACYGLCLLLAPSGVGAVICAGVCGAIAAYGCWGATCLICGC